MECGRLSRGEGNDPLFPGIEDGNILIRPNVRIGILNGVGGLEDSAGNLILASTNHCTLIFAHATTSSPSRHAASVYLKTSRIR